MSKIADYGAAVSRSITVFGWSRTESGTPKWEEAERLGRLAAEKGYSIVSGGYSGSMTAVSKGAKEAMDQHKAPSQEVVGVVVSEIFPDREREGNAYLTRTVDSNSMLHRIDQMMHLSRYFVILPGTMGTLQEITCVWMTAVLHPKDLPGPVIVAIRDPWEKCARGMVESLGMPPEQLDLITFVDTAEEAMKAIEADAVKMGYGSS